MKSKTKRLRLTFIRCFIGYNLGWFIINGIPNALSLAVKAEKVEYIEVKAPEKQITVTDEENIKTLSHCANLSYYKPFTKAEGAPEITVKYFMKNGDVHTLSLNKTSAWRDKSSGQMKQASLLYYVIEGIYLDNNK